MKSNPKIDSALHVLKGAAEKVLDSTLTTSVYAEENKGRLTVEYREKPTEEQIQEIEKAANNKIEEDVPIEMFKMDRKEAEARYGSKIYDKFPLPAHIQSITITRIKDWNVNCCLGPHVKTTKEIGKLRILKYRPRLSRKELEISFELV